MKNINNNSQKTSKLTNKKLSVHMFKIPGVMNQRVVIFLQLLSVEQGCMETASLHHSYIV